MNNGFEGGRRIKTQAEIDAELRHTVLQQSLNEAFGVKSGEVAEAMGPLSESDILPFENPEAVQRRRSDVWRDREVDRNDFQDRFKKEQGIKAARKALRQEFNQ